MYNENESSPYGQACSLQALLILVAEGKIRCGTGMVPKIYDARNADYTVARHYFLHQSNMRHLLPDFIKNNRDLQAFWEFIQLNLATYADRRKYIRNQFMPLLDALEKQNSTPAECNISMSLKKFDQDSIYSYWQKALERKDTDPDGAITISKSLVEGVCKHILDLQNIDYKNDHDLIQLYKMASQALNLDAGQHGDETTKKILSGCSAVIRGLAELRNAFGDAHGKSIARRRKPSARHAELAINLSGTMASFLAQTYEKTSSKNLTKQG